MPFLLSPWMAMLLKFLRAGWPNFVELWSHLNSTEQPLDSGSSACILEKAAFYQHFSEQDNVYVYYSGPLYDVGIIIPIID